MADVIEARVKQKKDTLANWEANPMIILDGEQAFVVSDSGQPINFKIGDGTKRFSELPYWIDYAGGQYIEISGNELPTPSVDVGYTFVGPGTYTFAGQPDIVAPDGRFSQLVWDGTSWFLKDMGALPAAPPVTKPVIQQFAYTKDEYVNQVLVDTAIAPTITINSVVITDAMEKAEWLKKLDACFKSVKVFGLPEGKFILIRQFSVNPAGNLGIAFVVADNETDAVNINANGNGFVAVAKDYSKPFTIEFKETYRKYSYLVTLDVSPLGGNNVSFNFRDGSGMGSYRTCGIKYTSVNKIPTKGIWGTDYDYTNGLVADPLPQSYYFHEAIKAIRFTSNSNELLRFSNFSYDSANSNIICVLYSCLDDDDSNLAITSSRNGYSVHRFTIPVADRGIDKRYKLTTISGSSTLKGDLIIDLDYLHAKLPSLATTGISVIRSSNNAQWILTPGGSGGGGIVTSLIIVGGGDSFRGNFSFNPAGNWAINATGNMSKIIRIPDGTTSLDFNMALNGVGFNILYMDKDFNNIGWGYDGSSGTVSSFNSIPPSNAVFFVVSTSTPVASATVRANGSFPQTSEIKTYRSLHEGLGDVTSGNMFIVNNKYFRKLKTGVCTLEEYTPVDGGWLDSVPELEKDGGKIIPTNVSYSGSNGTFTGGVLVEIKKGVMYFYNSSAKAVYKSSDGGSTFQIISDKFLHPTVWTDDTATIVDARNALVILENGDILIPVRVKGEKFATTNGVDRYKRFWTLWKYTDSNGVMTKCFNFSHESYTQDWNPAGSDYGWPYHSSGCMLGDFTHAVYGNIVVITEYGDGTGKYWKSQGVDNNARGVSARTWVSFNNGDPGTWKKCFDGDRKKTGTAEADNNWFYFTSTNAAKMRHMHGVSIDTHEKRVYQTNGDNEDYRWSVSIDNLQSWYNSAPSVTSDETPSYKEADTFPVWESILIKPKTGNSNYGYSFMGYQMMQNIAVNNGTMLELHDDTRSFAYISFKDSLGNLVFEPVWMFERPSDFASTADYVAKWNRTNSFVQHAIKHNGVIYVTFNNDAGMPSRIEATIDGYKWKTVYEGDTADIKFAGKILFDGEQVYLADGTYAQASNTSGYYKLRAKVA